MTSYVQEPTEEEMVKRLKCNTQTKSYTKKSGGKPSFDKEANRLWSLVVRLRAGGCEICGKEADFDRYGRMVKGMDAHHIIGRRNYLFRYNINNGVCLCPSCHMFNRDWSPHYDLPSAEGFKNKLMSMTHLMYRGDWYLLNHHRKGGLLELPKNYQELQYLKLLDIFCDILDKVNVFPNEPTESNHQL